MNYVHFLGRLARDPELRSVGADGTKVCKFTIGVDANFKKKDATPCWIDCDIWNKPAELVMEHFKKGSPIIVHGELALDQWEHEGQKRSKHKVRVDRFEFCPKNAGAPSNGGGGGNETPAPEEEVPF